MAENIDIFDFELNDQDMTGSPAPMAPNQFALTVTVDQPEKPTR
jgi:hypothetical protein